MLSRLQVFEPEGAVCFIEVVSLIAVIAMHSVRIYHEFEILALSVHYIQKLEGVLMMNVVVSSAMGKFEHYRFDGLPSICR